MKTRTWSIVCGIALILLLGGAQALAAPFAKQIAFTQPDGAQIQLWGQGDEFYAEFETLDGYSVVFDPVTEAYCYARLSPNGGDSRNQLSGMHLRGALESTGKSA